MRLLAIETSGTHGGIALVEEGRVIGEVRLAEGHRHARDLVAAIKEACDRAAWDKRHIGLVALGIGPGSFTGIRVAVTLAKFIAWDTGAKVVAVPTLLALAGNAPGGCRRVVPVLDAKRGGLFASIFERRQADAAGGGGGRLLDQFDEVFGPALIEPADLAERLAKPALILGHGILKGREPLAGFDLAGPDLWTVRPCTVARLGWELHERGQYADPLRLEPVYIRPPEAQEIWDRRHAKLDRQSESQSGASI
jgi:tRNA threonylcarbamoyladenosine biosynthesis protein TsaB